MTTARHEGRAPGVLEHLVVEPSSLAGVVRVGGAKNSALRCLVASLLTPEPVALSNFPSTLYDTHVQLDMLKALGKQVELDTGRATVRELTAPPHHLEWPGRSIRNTLLVLGALVARTGEASVPLPGGCEIGSRPFDLHEGLLRALGAEVWVDGDRLHARCDGGLRPGVFESSIRSTGVTENALLCGALVSSSEGVTLVNPHLTPEVLDLAGMLRTMGATVDCDGTRAIHVRGQRELTGASWRVIPDRIEAVTWAAAAVTTRGDVEIVDFPVYEASVALDYLRAAGARVYRGDRSVIVRSDGPEPFQLAAGAHPAVHSDMQPVFGAVAALARGRSELVDLRYPDRFGYVAELRKLGLRADVERGRATIDGGPLGGGAVTALDLRAGAALVVAGLGASAPVRVDEAWQVLRGYDDFVAKLDGLGAGVTSEYAPS